MGGVGGDIGVGRGSTDVLLSPSRFRYVGSRRFFATSFIFLF